VAGILKQSFKGIDGMRIINDRRKTGACNLFKPSGDTGNPADPFPDILDGNSKSKTDGNRRKDIIDVVSPDQRGPDLHITFRRPDLEDKTIDGVFRFNGPEVRLLLQTEGHYRPGTFSDQALSPRIVCIDHRNPS